jgi:hypothetical protein
MKNVLKFAALSLFMVSALASCDQAPASLADMNKKEIKLQNRDIVKQAGTFSAALANVDMATVQQLVVAKKQKQAAADDAAFVTNIYSSLQAAENQAAALTGVSFTISDAPVEDGVFLFALDSKQAQNLTFEMFDEEGFQMAANNTLNLTEGNNYKAINVSTLNNGEYVVRVKNADGQELVQRVTIKQD